MARAVGLDIGAHHVRLVEADGGGRGLRVLRLGEREIAVAEGGSREDAVRDAVDALFRDTRASRAEVVLTWPAEACVIRELNVPFREPDQIRRVVKFEFESHLHGRELEEIVLDFVPTGDTREGTRLLCAGADKAPLRALLKSLEGVKVDPVAVDLDVTALLAGLAAAGVLEETPTAVIADVGARSTKIALVVEGRLRTVRAFRGGADSLAAGIERDLGVPAGEGGARATTPEARADDLLAVPGAAAASDAPAAERSGVALERELVVDRRSDYVSRLSRELTRTLGQAGPGATFPLLWVTGRGSRVPGLRETLAAELGMEVRHLDLFARVPGPVPPEMMDETNASYAAALGAAARGLGRAPVALDLRREDLTYARRFEQIKGALAVTLALLLLGVGFLLWKAKREHETARADLVAMVATVKATAGQVEDRYKVDLTEAALQKLKAVGADDLSAVPSYNQRSLQMFSHLRDEMGLTPVDPPIASSLETFRLVHAAIGSIREGLEYCLVASETYNQKGVELNLVVSETKDVDTVKNALAGIVVKNPKDAKDPGRKLFAEVAPGTVKVDQKTGKVPVQFNCVFEKKVTR